MDKIKLTNQLKKTWIQLELAKREKTNELWIIEAQIEKIKSKIKSYVLIFIITSQNRTRINH